MIEKSPYSTLVSAFGSPSQSRASILQQNEIQVTHSTTNSRANVKYARSIRIIYNKDTSIFDAVNLSDINAFQVSIQYTGVPVTPGNDDPATSMYIAVLL